LAQLEAERRRFDGERGALQSEIERHRLAAAEREQALHSLHAEIERLNGLMAEMEGTKAWRLHRAVERLRGR
jgi:chromosome segregation ATPase